MDYRLIVLNQYIRVQKYVGSFSPWQTMINIYMYCLVCQKEHLLTNGHIYKTHAVRCQCCVSDGWVQRKFQIKVSCFGTCPENILLTLGLCRIFLYSSVLSRFRLLVLTHSHRSLYNGTYITLQHKLFTHRNKCNGLCTTCMQ